MNKRNAFVIFLGLAVALAAVPAFAQGKGKGGEKSSDKGKEKSAQVEKSKDKGKSSNQHTADGQPGPDERPAGWDKGNKEGWGDCNVPPGLAKKRGCDASGLSSRERHLKRRKERAEARKKAKEKAAAEAKKPSTAEPKKQSGNTAGTPKTTPVSSTTAGTRSVGGGNTSTKARPVKE